MAVLSAGCIDMVVYSNLERVYPNPFGATGTVTDQHLMGGDTSDFGRFTAGDAGTVAFGNSIDPVTKTADSEKFTVNIKYADVTSAQPAGHLTLRIVYDNGATEDHPLTLIDFDGSTHGSETLSNKNFKDYDTNGDGVISVLLAHDASDLNTINVYYMWLDVDYSTQTTPTTPTTSTGNVEFYTDPIGASIYVDGECKGTTMAYTYGVLTVPLSEGSHTWLITKDGYNSKSGNLNVIADQTITITETLTVVTAGDTGTPTPSNVAPSAVITAVQPSQSMVVFNSDKSTDSDGSIVKREWSLNGKVVTNAVQYQFSTSDKETGTYTVQLTVTDNGGATGTAQYIITLEGKTITETATVPSTDITEVPDATPTGTDEGMTFVLPGFEGVFAIIGLLAVALMRRDR